MIVWIFLRKIAILFFLFFVVCACQKVDLNTASGYDDLSSENKIVSFRFLGVEIPIRSANSSEMLIDSSISYIVETTMPIDTNISQLTPIIKISEKAVVLPRSGEEENFSESVIYTVMAENGEVSKYKVIVHPYVETNNSILKFSIGGLDATIDEVRRFITLVVPDSVDITNVSPNIVVTSGASSNPSDGETLNFSNPITYSVVSLQNELKDYVVSVSTLNLSANSIFKFIINGLSADIDQSTRIITAMFPEGTDLSNMSSKITYSSGATLTNNTNKNQVTDFTMPVIYTVTGFDGISKDYTVLASLPRERDSCLITSFFMNGIAGVIDDELNKITVELPVGTNFTSIAPIITISEYATVSPESGASQNFTAPFYYTVTAEDGVTQRTYEVKVNYPPSSEGKILSFLLRGTDGQIRYGVINHDLYTIDLSIPASVIDVNSATPQITISAQSTVDPEQGAAVDFSTPAIYSVTAENGMTSRYVVTIHLQ